MTFSVGTLYSSQTLLRIVDEGGLAPGNFESNFMVIEVADAASVLALSQKCHWLAVDSRGHLRLTERGTALFQLKDADFCLREQLFDLIIADPPPWARRIIQGRYEAYQAMPDSARQCFRSCGLINDTDDDTVDWWDRAATMVRAERTKVNHVVGRKAEKLTLKYELVRTGVAPIWQAIETNVSGFDVLSIVNPQSPDKLKIEVKGSGMRRSEASFYLTRNEWQTALTASDFHFHLWLVHSPPKLFVVPANELKPHVPIDGESGRWETAQLFYKQFLHHEVIV